MFKSHLNSVFRKFNDENKSEFDFCLTQNERNLDIDLELFDSFKKSITQKDIRFYPDLNNLKIKLSKYLNLNSDTILITPGSDIAIKTLFESIEFNSGHFLTTDYHFPMYSVYGALYNIKSKLVKYKKNLTYSVEDLISLVDKDSKLIILANPNSPLGDYKKYEELLPIIELGIPILVDEAYIELTSNQSLAQYINKHPNLFICRTFSKGLGAAGCRVGYIVSSAENINILNKFRFMYEVTSLSGKYTEFILDNIEHFNQYAEQTLKGKSKLSAKLKLKYPNDVIDTDSAWCFLKSTPSLTDIFTKHKVGYRTITLPEQAEEYIKFNYDLSLEGSNFLNELLDEKIN